MLHDSCQVSNVTVTNTLPLLLFIQNGGYQFINEIKTCTDNAWSAGFEHVDIYVFMCPNCRGNQDGVAAVQRIVNSLTSLGVKYGQIWVDVEQCDGCWNDAASVSVKNLIFNSSTKHYQCMFVRIVTMSRPL